MSKILLADDSLTIQKVVELTFADTEHDVVAVSDGTELLRRLPETLPDIVISDVIMPGIDGYEVCQQVKSDPATLHVPVILLTGTFEPFDRDRALAAGCSEIITKPFEARKLVETVERLLAEGATAAPAPVADHDQGSVQPPPATPEIQPSPPPTMSDSVDFGTRMASAATIDDQQAAAEEESLEFTSTGFAEMEAAAESADSWSEGAPDEGLEFEIGDDTANRMAQAASDEYGGPPPAELDTQDGEPIGDTDDEPFPEPPALEEADVAAFADTHDEPAPFGDEPSEESADAAQPVEPGVAPSEDPFPTEVAPEARSEPFSPARTTPIARPPAGDWSSAAPPPLPDDDDDAGIDVESDDQWDESPTRVETVPPMAAAASPPEDEVSDELSTGADLADDFDDEADLARADTTPLMPPEPRTEPEHTPPPPPPSAVEPEPVSAASTTTGLSDEDVERIARRVVELAADRIEHIAWEVIPDMAEIIVRERVRELEADIERATPDVLQ